MISQRVPHLDNFYKGERIGQGMQQIHNKE